VSTGKTDVSRFTTVALPISPSQIHHYKQGLRLTERGQRWPRRFALQRSIARAASGNGVPGTCHGRHGAPTTRSLGPRYGVTPLFGSVWFTAALASNVRPCHAQRHIPHARVLRCSGRSLVLIKTSSLPWSKRRCVLNLWRRRRTFMLRPVTTDRERTRCSQAAIQT
jgi:hypothetical protein